MRAAQNEFNALPPAGLLVGLNRAHLHQYDAPGYFFRVSNHVVFNGGEKMHKDAAANKRKTEDNYHYEEPMSLGWFIALIVSCAIGVCAVFMGLVWIATA